jgi:hypothetical protein
MSKPHATDALSTFPREIKMLTVILLGETPAVGKTFLILWDNPFQIRETFFSFLETAARWNS